MERDAKMIVYIAGPYTQGNRTKNVIAAVKAAERVRAMGHLPFVPHLSHFWDIVSPHEYEYWMQMGLEWIGMCDVVLRLPGESPGAEREVKRALELGKLVVRSVKELKKWTTGC